LEKALTRISRRVLAILTETEQEALHAGLPGRCTAEWLQGLLEIVVKYGRLPLEEADQLEQANIALVRMTSKHLRARAADLYSQRDRAARALVRERAKLGGRTLKAQVWKNFVALPKDTELKQKVTEATEALSALLPSYWNNADFGWDNLDLPSQWQSAIGYVSSHRLTHKRLRQDLSDAD
jgi:hypothetical protein